MADVSLVYNILGRDRVSDVLRRVKREAATANDENVKGFRDLDAQIEKTRGTVAKLAAEFGKTGNDDILRDFRRENRTLKGLEKLRGEFRGLGDDGVKAGGLISTAFSGVLEKVGTLAKSHPYIAAGIAAGIVIGAPVIGAAINSAVLLGIGGGALVGGIVLAARDSRVKAAFTEIGRSALSELSGAAEVFINPLLRGARSLRSEFDTIMPSIRGSFSTLAPIVERLIAGVGQLARNAMPGVNAAIQASAPILNTLASHLPQIGQALSDMFSMMAAGGPGAAAFFHDFLTFVESSARSVGALVGFLSQMYSLLRDTTPLGWLIDLYVKMNGGEKSAQAMKTSVEDLANAASGMAPSMDVGTSSVGRIEKSFRDAIREAGYFDKALEGLNGGNIELATAQIEAERAIRTFKEALKESHGSLDISTEKGAAAKEAAIRLATASGGVAQAMYEQSGSSGKASGALGGLRESMIRSAIQSGMTSAAAHALADEYFRMPDNVKTPVSAPGLASTRADLAEFSRGLDRIDGRYVKTTTVNEIISRRIDQGNIVAGGYRALARGGLRAAAVGTYLPPTDPGWILAGESRTGGEWLIPREGISQSRAKELGSAAMDSHGLDVVSKSAGRPSAGMAMPVAGRGGTTTINNTYHIHDATDPNRVVSAIRRYEQSNGAGWRR